MKPDRQSGELNRPDPGFDGASCPAGRAGGLMASAEARPRLVSVGWLLLGKVEMLCGQPGRSCRWRERLLRGLACRRSTASVPTSLWPPGCYAASIGRIASSSLGLGYYANAVGRIVSVPRYGGHPESRYFLRLTSISEHCALRTMRPPLATIAARRVLTLR